jgi:hypothetical protein
LTTSAQLAELFAHVYSLQRCPGIFGAVSGRLSLPAKLRFPETETLVRRDAVRIQVYGWEGQAPWAGVLMKIDRTKTIGGVPLIKVRDLLRYMGAGTIGGERTLTREGITRRVGRDIADELVGEGLLEVREKDRDGGPWYEITDAAPRLANVKMLKRISRSKADLYVAELLRRADDINANPELLYRVKRITAFGSYITDAADLGDIDIAVELEFKLPREQRVEANKARAKASGRLYLSLLDELSFGEREVKRLLRGRNRYISLTSYDSLKELRAPTKDIYPRPEGAPDC